MCIELLLKTMYIVTSFRLVGISFDRINVYFPYFQLEMKSYGSSLLKYSLLSLISFVVLSSCILHNMFTVILIGNRMVELGVSLLVQVGDRC